MKWFLIVVFCVGLPLSAYTQKERVIRQPYVDFRSYHLGFHIGMHIQDLFIANHLALYDAEYWVAEVPGYSPGISVGVIIDKKISSLLNLRLIPTMHLGAKKIVFKELQNDLENKVTIHSYYLQIPLEVKYSAIRIANYALYLTGGVYGSYDPGKQKNSLIQTKKLDYGISIGVGCDIYFHYFKLCPEIRFSFGLRNLLHSPDVMQLKENPFLSALEGMKSRMIGIVFNFE